MDRIVAVSDTVNAGIHALALAEANGGSISAREAAERLQVSPSYLAKIMQKLAIKGLLTPTRGLGGGYALAKPAEQISCLEVLTLLEGDLPRRECLFAKAVCRTGTCALRTFCADTEKRLRTALETTTIAAVARSF
ncbi:MAG: RrF2 family transcriptional regulator [Rectinema subterraneum]|uniref:RrF2 family transcriptional regulator n=1 Tax=Rectinema subterraneum TaxID=2653714 RepID=UPI003C7B4BC6